MKHILLTLLLTFSLQFVNAQGTLIGGLCEGCEAIFEYGSRMLSSVDTLPGFKESTQKLKVSGTVYQKDGETPAEDVILYIYHTNKEGIYPTRGDEQGWARRHGYLRGWIKTDQNGTYAFYTGMPGSYSSNPAHIHVTVLEPDGRYYYIDDYRFEGDPNLSRYRKNSPRGGSGIVKILSGNETPVVHRNIILGKNVP